MDLPTQEDINVYNSLDEITASEHFLGKTLDEAEALIREDSAYYQEDLMWMGTRGFAFYLQAAINYLQSDAAASDEHFLYCLANIIEFRRGQKDFSLALPVVQQLISYVIDNFNRFHVDNDIYGDLLDKYKHLQEELHT